MEPPGRRFGAQREHDWMRLTAEQFEQIVASLKSDSTRPRHHDKRSSPRVGVRMQATIIPCVTGQPARPHLVWVRDLSVHGIGLIYHDSLPIGSYFLAIFQRKGGEKLTVLYCVASCTRLSAQQTLIGARIDRVITTELLDAEPGPDAGRDARDP
jgi:hypothetical protein